MMDGSAIKELADRFAVPKSIVDARGQMVTMVPAGWEQVVPRQWAPDPVEATTLRAVVDYLRDNKDGIDLERVTVHVVDPTHVRILGPLEGEDLRFRRQCYLEAVAALPKIALGTYLESEYFGIMLRTGFVATEVVSDLLILLASIRDSDVRETVDDGLAQEVKTARGVAIVERTRVPSPVVLAPFRTFHEVEQPASEFVLRLRSGRGAGAGEVGAPTVALFDADGGAWRNAAMRSVADWLAAEFSALEVAPPVRIIA